MTETTANITVVNQSVNVSGTLGASVIVTGVPGVSGRDGIDGGYSPLDKSVMFNDLSPITMATLNAGSLLTLATICILEGFDGTGASLTIGTDDEPDKFIKLTDIDITQMTTNQVTINAELLQDETIKVFLNAGLLATGGKAFIRIEVKKNEYA